MSDSESQSGEQARAAGAKDLNLDSAGARARNGKDIAAAHGSTNGASLAKSVASESAKGAKAPKDATAAAPGTAWAEFFSFLKTLAVFLALAFLIRASVVEAFKIPSESMIPTLRVHDYILVSKLAYGIRLPFVNRYVYQYDSPKRGDVVVFTRPDDPYTPEDDSEINIIKRVIGLPGEIIEIKGRSVLINNRKLTEPYAQFDARDMIAGDFGPERIPDGHIFLMGDNRDHSRDSRFWEPSPYLDIQRVKGRAMLIYWSWDPTWQERLGKIIR